MSRAAEKLPHFSRLPTSTLRMVSAEKSERRERCVGSLLLRAAGRGRVRARGPEHEVEVLVAAVRERERTAESPRARGASWPAGRSCTELTCSYLVHSIRVHASHHRYQLLEPPYINSCINSLLLCSVPKPILTVTAARPPAPPPPMHSGPIMYSISQSMFIHRRCGKGP